MASETDSPREELLAPVGGTIIGTVLGTIVRYFAYRFWVYAKPLDSEPGFAPSTASEMATASGTSSL